MSLRHKNRDSVFFTKYNVLFWKIIAPAGTLGGAPSMFLCLEDIKRAYFMSLRHKIEILCFFLNIMSYFGKYTN